MSNMFNARFSELVAPIGKIVSASFSGAQNSGWVYVGDYHRIVIWIDPLTIGTNLAVQVNIATDANGSDELANFKHITTLTSVPGTPVVIEIVGTELGSPSGASGVNYDYIKVIATPSGTDAAVIRILGCEPRQQEVDQALYAEVVAI